MTVPVLKPKVKNHGPQSLTMPEALSPQEVLRSQKRSQQKKAKALEAKERKLESMHRLLLVSKQNKARQQQTVAKVDKPCTKLQHRSQEGAELHKQSLEKRGELYLHIYFCDKCRAWHVGHMSKSSINKLRKKQQNGEENQKVEQSVQVEANPLREL